MFTMRRKVLALQVIWIGGDWGTMAPIAGWGYSGNHDGTCDYSDMNNQSDIEAYKVFAKGDIIRKKQGRERRLFKQFRGKMQGVGGAEMDFVK